VTEQASDRGTRRADRELRRARRRASYATIYGSWMPGIILILLGGTFLAQNYLGTTLHNWWALFILIPAIATLTTAYALWRDGHADWATGPLIAGLGFVFLCGAFLLELPIGQIWPIFLIAAGLALLVGRGGGWGRWG
jgi:hypothetical protein